MAVIEYIEYETMTRLFRDRESSLIPPVGAAIRSPRDLVYKVRQINFDYATNSPDLWIVVLVDAVK